MARRVLCLLLLLWTHAFVASADALPPGATARLGSLSLRHGGHFSTAAFSPDSKVLASAAGGGDYAVRLWDVATGSLLHKLDGHTSNLFALAFAPDGKTLASGSSDQKILLWDPATGKQRQQLQAQGTVFSLAYTPDGKVLASLEGGAAVQGNGTIRLWDSATGQSLHVMDDVPTQARRVAFAPDGSLVAAGGWSAQRGQVNPKGPPDATVHVYSTATGKLHTKLPGPRQVAAVLFSADGKELIVSGYPDGIAFWDLATGKVRRPLQALKGVDHYLSLTRDGKTLVASGGGAPNDAAVSVWDLTTGKLTRRLPVTVTASVLISALAPDDRTIVTGGLQENNIRLWDGTTGQELLAQPGHRRGLTSVAFGPDGKTAVTGALDGLYQWDVGTSKVTRQLIVDAKMGVRSLAFSPDGGLLASGGWDRVVRFWDPASGKALRDTGSTGQFWVEAVAWSPDSRMLASGGDRTIRVWDATGKEVRKFEGQDSNVRALVFSPDGKLLASGANSRETIVWDLETGKDQARFQNALGSVSGVAFAPDSKRLAVSGYDGKVRILDVARKLPIAELGPHKGYVNAVAYALGGRLLVAADEKGIRFWDTDGGVEVGQFGGHEGPVDALAFAADGRRLITGSRDTTALIWDVAVLLHGGALPEKLTAEQVRAYWHDLQGAEPVKAYRALAALTADPSQSVAQARKHLLSEPPAADALKRAADLIRDLDSDTFDVRERATAALVRLGRPIVPAGRKGLDGSPPAEAARRLLLVLDELVPKDENARLGRAVALLEWIGDAEARRVLAALAKDQANPALAADAQAALERAARRERR